jgi:arylformamidase
VGYTLAPEANHDEMVAEVMLALDYLKDRAPLILSGWSAGGHLAAMSLDHPAVKSCLAISGLYDLEPVRHTGFNEALGMDEAAARRNSPIQLPLSGKRLDLAVGGAELPLMIGQTEDFAAARSKAPGRFELVPNADHFTILDALRDPAGQLTRMVVDLVRA